MYSFVTLLKNLVKDRRFLPILILTIFSLVIIFPPIYYHYIYPSIGDDSSWHLEVMDKIVEEGGITLPEGAGYYGPVVLGLICRVTGANTDKLFLIFNFMVLILAVVSIYFLLSKLVNREAGLISLPLVFLCSPGILTLFYCGTIFDILGMYILLPLAILFLVLWLKESKTYQLILTLFFLLLCSVLHSLTALYVFNSLAFFLVISLIYFCITKDHTRLKKYGLFSGFFFIVSFVISCIVLPHFLTLELGILSKFELGILSKDAIIEVFIPITVPRVSASQFFLQYFPPWSSGILFGSLTCLAILKLRGKLVLEKTTKLLLAILLAFLAVLFVGLMISMDSIRCALELSSFLAILTSITLSLIIKEVRKGNIRKLFPIATIVLIIIGCIIPLSNWFSYNSSIRPADKEALNYLNNLEGSTYSTSTQVAPWIYSRFTDKKYMEEGGDYIIYRTIPMSDKTNPDCLWFWYKRESLREDYSDKTILKIFEDKKVEVYIYENYSEDSLN